MPDKLEGDTSKPAGKTRLDQLKIDHKDELFEPEMPPVDAVHIVSYLFEIGPTMTGSMGAGPLTHGELRAYQENTGIDLSVWEVSTLVRLSKEYLSEASRATKRDCEAPWKPEDFKPDRSSVARRLQASVMQMLEE